ncbi:MAG: tyrosine-type recombinase/integrase [Terriglobales bacterium]|jgi:integrase
MAQRGELKAISGSWMVRYYDSEGKRRMKKLGRVDDYPKDTDIYPTLLQFMAEVNTPTFKPKANTLVKTFVDSVYFPSVSNLRGSTLRGYKAIWKNYLEPRLGNKRVNEVDTYICQQVMDSIVKANPKLKQATFARVKSFMHAVFADAIRLGQHSGKTTKSGKLELNFVAGVKIRCSNKAGKTFAYSIDEIKSILAALSEPSRVLMAVAAYSGLRRGEIVGLKWEDYDGEVIHVRRNICFGEKGEMSVEDPKTEASEADVPVIAPLRTILDAWKAKAQATAGVTDGCWIFQAGFTRKKDHPATLLDVAKLTPLSPANVLRDVVLPALEKAEIEWKGYHAFRRGLATNLRALSVDDLTIMEILRHSDVAVTRDSYIKRVSAKSVEAMDRFEAELAKPPKSVPAAKSVDVVLPASQA